MAAVTTPIPEVLPSEMFDGSSFNPRAYLEEYYSRIGSENQQLLDFFAEAYKDFPDASVSIIEVGGGPTLYQLISACRAAKEIVFTDYLETNIAEVKDYLRVGESHFNWALFAEAALKSEGRSHFVTDVQERIRLLQSRISKFTVCDILQVDPIEEDDFQYDVVSAQFVAESITSNRDQWRRALESELSLLKPGGHYISTGLLGADSWKAGDDEFVAFRLDPKTVQKVLKDLGLEIEIFKTIKAESVVGEKTPHQGYDGMFFVKAIKKK